ncbi:unnamed protein product, partial [Owenia fusiformis]
MDSLQLQHSSQTWSDQSEEHELKQEPIQTRRKRYWKTRHKGKKILPFDAWVFTKCCGTGRDIVSPSYGDIPPWPNTTGFQIGQDFNRVTTGYDTSSCSSLESLESPNKKTFERRQKSITEEMHQSSSEESLSDIISDIKNQDEPLQTVDREISYTKTQEEILVNAVNMFKKCKKRTTDEVVQSAATMFKTYSVKRKLMRRQANLDRSSHKLEVIGRTKTCSDILAESLNKQRKLPSTDIIAKDSPKKKGKIKQTPPKIQIKLEDGESSPKTKPTIPKCNGHLKSMLKSVNTSKEQIVAEVVEKSVSKRDVMKWKSNSDAGRQMGMQKVLRLSDGEMNNNQDSDLCLGDSNARKLGDCCHSNSCLDSFDRKAYRMVSNTMSSINSSIEPNTTGTNKNEQSALINEIENHSRRTNTVGPNNGETQNIESINKNEQPTFVNDNEKIKNDNESSR